MITEVLHTANVEHKNWKQESNEFLRNYKATLLTTTVTFPAKMRLLEFSFLSSAVGSFLALQGSIHGNFIKTLISLQSLN